MKAVVTLGVNEDQPVFAVLMRELVSHGHSIICITTRGEVIPSEEINARLAVSSSYLDDYEQPSTQDHPDNNFSEAELLCSYAGKAFRALYTKYDQLLSVCQKSDVLICHGYQLGNLVAAEEAQIPAVSINISPTESQSTQWIGKEIRSEIISLRSTRGLANNLPKDRICKEPDLTICACSPSLFKQELATLKTANFTGFFVNDAASGDKNTLQTTQATDIVVVLSKKAAMHGDNTASLLQALADLEETVLVCPANNEGWSKDIPLPPNCVLLDGVDLDHVMPRAKLIIHDGSPYPTAAALVGGVTSIVIGPSKRTELVLIRARAAGLIDTILPSNQITARRLLGSVRRALVAISVAQPAKATAAGFRTEGGTKLAVNLIHSLLLTNQRHEAGIEWRGSPISSHSSTERQPAAPVERTSRPLSFPEQQLWFVEQLDGGSSAYSMPFALRMVGQLDVSALERAISLVGMRHDVLRTTFTVCDGIPKASISDTHKISLQKLDLSQLAPETSWGRIQEIARLAVMQPFNLESGPLLRLSLIKTAVKEWILLANMHHIISDGWSVDIMFREINHLYQSFSVGRPPLPPAFLQQYSEFARWQNDAISSPEMTSQLHYWRQQLEKVSPLNLPFDRERQASPTNKSRSVVFEILTPDVTKLKQLSRAHGATLFMTLLTLLNVLLFRLTGNKDICIGCPTSGRSRPEVMDVMGLFVNTVVIRTILSAGIGFTKLLRSTKEVTLAAYKNQDIPFERVVADLSPERRVNETPFFQTLFSMFAAEQHFDLGGLAIDDISPSVYSNLRYSKYDIALSCSPSEAGLYFLLTYKQELFDESTIKLFVNRFLELVQSVLTNPQTSIGELQIITLEEYRRLSQRWIA